MAPSSDGPREAGKSGAPVAPAGFVSLRWKAMLLFTAMTLAPVAVAASILLEVNRDAVRVSENQLQAAVLAEVSGRIVGLVSATQADAEAVAAALGEAAFGAGKEDDALAGVRALVATRRTIRSVRFEVPDAGVATEIRDETGPAGDAPRSTPELRAAADERGAGFVLTGPGRGALVVPIPRRAGSTGARGYVTVAVDLAPLGGELADIAATRFDEGRVSLLVADAERRAVAAYGVPGGEAGRDTAALPVWGSLPKGTPWKVRAAVVSEHVEDGTPMVGALEAVGDLGWTVAIWRPEPIAFRALERMRTYGAAVAIGSVALALLVGLLAARAVTAPVVRIASQARLIGERRWREIRLASGRRDELGQLERSIGRMAEELETSEATIASEAKLRGDLSRFMSKELVDSIVRGDHPLALGGSRAQVSVLFADVVAFTPLAESRPAEQVVALLNELFSVLTEVVFRHGGTVDKFIGDCLMAVWGAPVAAPDHAARALAAAEDMMRFLETAAAGWRTKYDVEVRLGIGVNSGEAIVGNIGSDKRMEYTVVGDVVNVAARLEGIAQPNQVLVAEATYELAHEDFALRLLGERKLTGRKRETKVYELQTS